MGRKAQMTVIMIMVVIILAIFGVMYYLTSSAKERQAEKEIQTQKIAETKIKPVQEYIKSCLDLVSKNAVETMGKQGGYLFETQGSIIPDYKDEDFGKKYLLYDNLKAAYSVYPPEGSVALYTSSVPSYPWEGFPNIETATGPAEYFFGFFGYNKVPPSAKPFPLSVQEQLENYTQSNIKKCLDWSSFEKQGLQIRAGEPRVNVTIADTTTIFTMKYPITITDNISKAEQHLEDFAAIYNIRLKQIFAFVEKITDRDVTDIRFDISKPAEKDMSTKVVKNIAGTMDDIIIVTDAKSTILDKPFEFRFARHNRNPALHYLDNQTISNNREFGICVGATLTILQGIKNELKIDNPPRCTSNPKDKTIELKVDDPDEDMPILKLVIGQERLTYTVEPTDFYHGYFNFRIQASDNELFDWQNLALEMKAIEVD